MMKEATFNSGRRITFENVEIKGTKTFVCADCGKTRSRTEAFSQTINPFNINASGEPKSRSEITTEIIADRDAWKPGPTCGCKARAGRDERPKKRRPNIWPTQESTDIHPLLDRADELYKELDAISTELKRRLVGLRIKEGDRLGYVTTAGIERSRHSSKSYAQILTWLESKRDPKTQFGGDGHYKSMNEVEIVWPQPDESAQ